MAAEMIADRLKIRLDPGSCKQTKINIPSYEMYQAELLDRMLLSIEKTEEAYIDINNRIIANVNARKDRLNMINQRIQGVSSKILALYDKNMIPISSPANLPKISTFGSASNHPHQSIFFDKIDVQPLADEIGEGAQL